MIPRILIIAGSDSGGGAGIQADIKTVTMLQGHAMTAITAITAQNTLGVAAVMPVPAQMVLAQIDAVVGDIGVDAVKIGMIGSAETAHAVAERLAALDVPIVFDPVMVATSGSRLADAATIAAFRRLLGVATVATPNAPELADLTGRAVDTAVDLAGAAAALAAEHGIAVLAKGGHIEGREVFDLLCGPEGTQTSWTGARIATRHTHGTGCTLASALATGLARGVPLEKAVAQAREFVRGSLLAAPGLGGGHGPMGHWAAPTGIMNLNQVTLPARDYREAVDFYRGLGLTQIVDSPGNGYARFECPGGATLSIHVEAQYRAGGATIYFEAGDLDEWVQALRRRGIEVLQTPRDERWGWRETRLEDPSGNRLCLYRSQSMRRFPPWRLSTGE